MKVCGKCKSSKSENLFSKGQYWCKDCVRQYQALRKDDSRKYRKQFYIEHREEINNTSKQYRVNNREDIKRYNAKYFSTRRSNDIVFSLRGRVSSAIRQAIKKSGTSKNGKSSTKYLPYTIKKLQEHLERQFEPWMTWNNHGKYNSKTWNDKDFTTWAWQIDHIIPQSKLPYTSMEDENFQKCWALDNLRPLSAKQNLLDGVHRKRHLQ